MFKSELSEQVSHFQNNGQGWDDLLNQISVFIYKWALYRRGIGGELAAEFYLSFYPRITSLVRNYREYDCPFEHYMRVCLEWHTKKFHGHMKEEKKKEEIYWETTGKFELLMAAQKNEDYGSLNNPVINMPHGIERDRFKKRLLQFLIYYVDYIRPEMISPYADFLEMEEDRLRHYLREAEIIILKQKKRKEELLQKRRGYSIDLKYNEMKLRLVESEKRAREINDHMARLQERMGGLQFRADRIKMTPTTVEVAQIAGVKPSTAGRDIKLMRQYLKGQNIMGPVYAKALNPDHNSKAQDLSS